MTQRSVNILSIARFAASVNMEDRMDNAKDILRMMQSLAIVVQDSAETGNLDASVYADIAELMGSMAARAESLIGTSSE